MLNEILKTLTKYAINMKPEMVNEAMPGCVSKIGGKPDLPKNFVWPYYDLKDSAYGELKNRPLSFIAQINLRDIQEMDSDNLLPHSGMLYFFYEFEAMCAGLSKDEEDCAKVYYFDNSPEEMVSTEFPEDLSEDYIVPEQKLEFEKSINLPSFEEYTDTNKTDIDWKEYDKELINFGIDPERDINQAFKLLGYADLIQGSILSECEIVSNDYTYNQLRRDKELAERVKTKAKDWILLAQFDTLSDDLMFGDCGLIYYYIRKQDLKELNFNNIHFSMQCY